MMKLELDRKRIQTIKELDRIRHETFTIRTESNKTRKQSSLPAVKEK